MRAITIIAHVGEQHLLHNILPNSVMPGDVQIQLLMPSANGPEENDADASWGLAAIRAWTADWSDSREDIYDIPDGEPSH